jgi:hypothetical protein
MRFNVLAKAAAALAVVAGLAAARSSAKEGAAFVVMLGRDTVAVESYMRMDSVLQGTSVVRGMQTLTRNYKFTTGKSGLLSAYEVTVFPPGKGAGDKPMLHATMTPMGDAIHEVIHTDSARTMHIVVANTVIPFMNYGFGMWEALVMRAVKGGKDSTEIPQLFVNDTTHYSTVVKRLGSDSVTINSIFGLARAKIDKEGHILGYSAPGSTQQVVVTRVSSFDVAAFATRYAAMPMGTLSPADTARATIGGANLMVAYSQPSVRGRKIFGDVVPWNVVWRAGANSATTFTTDKDIMIAGTLVPAGEYTFFTLPNPTGWKLIISKRTKEWGTEYDPTMDLARVDMTTAQLAAPVEKLKYAFTANGLTLSWDRTAVSVPIAAK